MKYNHYINNLNTPRGVPRRLPWARPRPAALPAPEPRAGPREIPIISATPFYNNCIKQRFSATITLSGGRDPSNPTIPNMHTHANALLMLRRPITKGFGNKARPFYNNNIKQQFPATTTTLSGGRDP